jgi:hypothetical protein
MTKQKHLKLHSKLPYEQHASTETNFQKTQTQEKETETGTLPPPGIQI